MNTNIIFKEESYRVIGACFEVYKELGSGFLEAVHQQCLNIELKKRGIPFEEKPRISIQYKGVELDHFYEPDFLCFDKVILEIKAVRTLDDEHRAQVINYVKATGKQLALLVNFGHFPRIQHERYLRPIGLASENKVSSTF